MPNSANQPAPSAYRDRVQRSQWLRDLATALDRAERLTGELAGDPAADTEVAAIRARIAQVRATLAMMRAGRSDEINPNWLKLARALAPLPGDNQTP